MVGNLSSPSGLEAELANELQTHPSASRLLDRSRNKMKIIRLHFEGLSDDAIGRQFGVDQSSITRFRQRHAATIESMRAAFESEAADYVVASKVQRIADYDQLRTLLQAEIQERGIAWDEETRHGIKRHLSAAVPELRATLQQAALEMDQLPRAGITIANQNVVIVKQVTTEDANPEL